MSGAASAIEIRRTRAEDFEGIIELCSEVYPAAAPWSEYQLASHLEVFPEGQLVAVDSGGRRVVGMAASLIVLWDDYDVESSWRDFTAGGTFRNHDAERGRTLYGAEVMVLPSMQGRGIGSGLYAARKELARRLGLRRIRAGARIRGYARHAAEMTAEEYVARVERGELRDPTLSFQLHQGFRVIAVVRDYLRNDPESLGTAAVVEWLNPAAAPGAATHRPGTRSET